MPCIRLVGFTVKKIYESIIIDFDLPVEKYRTYGLSPGILTVNSLADRPAEVIIDSDV
jgi:hypothetical protein